MRSMVVLYFGTPGLVVRGSQNTQLFSKQYCPGLPVFEEFTDTQSCGKVLRLNP